MGLTGSVAAAVDDDDVLVRSTVRVSGSWSAPRGSTLQAIEELVRAVVQHGLSGRSARLRVDVGGYRERRREALAAFARQVAEEVRETTANEPARADEPARPQGRARHGRRDRRGQTSSEGEEPRRRVVISPA